MTQKKIEGKFYPLTPEVASKIGEAKLTPTEWKLWSYLITLDPFGDRYQELPPLGSVLAEVGISKASFYRALARLQELDVVSDRITVNSVNRIEAKADGRRQEAEGKNLEGDSNPHQISATESKISVGDSNPCSRTVAIRLVQRSESKPSALCPLPPAFLVEFKNIKDWKGTLGQILPYSAYYPSHRKRIHLFKENLDKLADIKSACRTFKAIVTGEGA
jgi:hypothetical protein